MSRRSLNGIESDDVRSLNGLSVHSKMLKKLKATQPLEYDADTFTYSLKGLNGFTANKIIKVNPAGDALIYADDNNTEYTGTNPIDITGTTISLKGLNGFTANKFLKVNSAGNALEYADDNNTEYTGTNPIDITGTTISLKGLSGFTANKIIKVNSAGDALEYADDSDTNFWDLSSNGINLYPKENIYNVFIGNKDYNNTNNVELVIDGDMEITGKQRSQDSSEIYIEWNDSVGIQLYGKDTGSGKSFNMAFRNSGQAGSGAAFPYIGCDGTNGSSLAVFITNVVTTHTLFNNDLSTTHNGNLVCNNNISVKNGATSSGSVSFFEDSDFGSNSIKLQAPLTAIGSDKILTLPDVTATLSYNGQNISLFNNDEGFIDSAGVSSQIASAENISTASILFNPNRTFGNALSATFINGSSINITGTALKIGNGSTNAGKIQFLENTSGGSNSITLKPHAETFGDLEITLPSSDGQLALTSSLSGFITETSTSNLSNKTFIDMLKVLISTATNHTIAEFFSPSLNNGAYNELRLGVNSSGNNHGVLNFYYDSAGDGENYLGIGVSSTGREAIKIKGDNGKITLTSDIIDTLSVKTTTTSDNTICNFLSQGLGALATTSMFFGKLDSENNTGTFQYYHSGDGLTTNYLAIGTKGNETALKVFTTGKITIAEDLTLSKDVSIGENLSITGNIVNTLKVNMTNTSSFDIATFLAPNLSNTNKVEMLIGKADSASNCGVICYYHDSDGDDSNYIGFGTNTHENAIKIYGNGYICIENELNMKGESYVDNTFYADRYRLTHTGGYFETYADQVMYFGSAQNGGNTYFYYNNSLSKIVSLGNWTTFSDERLKTHIETGDEVEKEMADYFDKIEVNKYGYIKQFAGSKGTTTETKSFGFIAQQVEQVYPQGVGDAGNCIFPSPKSTDPDKIEINDCLAVDKEKINMLLWGKVKQQQKQIDKQQEQIERLEKKINLILALDNDK